MKVALSEGAKMPTRAHPWDGGLDLYAMDFRACCQSWNWLRALTVLTEEAVVSDLSGGDLIAKPDY